MCPVFRPIALHDFSFSRLREKENAVTQRIGSNDVRDFSSDRAANALDHACEFGSI
jgi:hypothetical protein